MTKTARKKPKREVAKRGPSERTLMLAEVMRENPPHGSPSTRGARRRELHPAPPRFEKAMVFARGSPEPIVLSLSGLEKKYNISRASAARAVEGLRLAGLIEVAEKKPGQALRVRLRRPLNAAESPARS